MTAAPARSPQQAFTAALRDPALPVPAGVVTWNGSDPAARFAVYRNNVVASLVAALADTFPVVRELVGGECFAAMARRYVAEQPPTSPVVALYGDGFADWLACFAPAAAVPCLPDMARLERARVRAYHAADAPVLAADAIAARLADPAQLPQATLVLHPSVAVVRSRHAILSLCAAHQGRGRIEDVDPGQPQSALVLRFEDDAAVLAIPAGAAAFYGALQRGLPLGRAAVIDEPLDEALDLGASLALLIRYGAICAWQSSGDRS